MPRSLFARFFFFMLPLLCGLTSCANSHVLPRLKPLFSGLDESRVSVSAKTSLAHAKEDFQLARSGQEPRHARSSGGIPSTHSRIFQGEGYTLTLVNKDLVNALLIGPEIVIDGRITNGGPYHYDEIDRIED